MCVSCVTLVGLLFAQIGEKLIAGLLTMLLHKY